MSVNREAQPPFAVLWDLDGVLVDTHRYHFDAFRGLQAEGGRGLLEERFQPMSGSTA